MDCPDCGRPTTLDQLDQTCENTQPQVSDLPRQFCHLCRHWCDRESVSCWTACPEHAARPEDDDADR